MSEETFRNNRTEGYGGDDRGRSGPPRDKDGTGDGPRGKGRRRRKVSFLTLNKIETVDYKDVNILRRFLNDRGKILPSRQSGNTSKQQRMIAQAVRRAREMALLPFAVTEINPERREYGGGRRERGYDRPYGNRVEQQAPAAAVAEGSEQVPAKSEQAPPAE